MTAPDPSPPARPLVDATLDIEAFAADWKHCDHIANYLARLVSADRADSFLHANLLSTVLNELLEMAFAHHAPAGEFSCSLARLGAADRITLQIPVDEAGLAFYRGAVAASQSAQAGELYNRSLLGDPNPGIGLLELAADYRAGILLEENTGPAQVRLTVELHLEELCSGTLEA